MKAPNKSSNSISRSYALALAIAIIGGLAYGTTCLLLFGTSEVLWIEFIFTFVALLFSAATIKRNLTTKLIYAMPQYAIAACYLAAQIIVSVFAMALQHAAVPWCYIANILLLAAFGILQLLSRTTTTHIASTDTSIRANISPIVNVMTELAVIRDSADIQQKVEIDALIETAQCSNLRSCDSANSIDNEILQLLNELRTSVDGSDYSKFSSTCFQLNCLLKRRDVICKSRKE